MPAVRMAVGDATFVWAEDGPPTLLDHASVALLESFAEPLSPDELAADLVDVFGMSPEAARAAAGETTFRLGEARLLAPVDGDLPDPWEFNYPAAASV